MGRSRKLKIQLLDRVTGTPLTVFFSYSENELVTCCRAQNYKTRPAKTFESAIAQKMSAAIAHRLSFRFGRFAFEALMSAITFLNFLINIKSYW